MADKELVEELLYTYVNHNVDKITSYLLDKVHAELGTYTEVTMDDIERALRKLYGKAEKPKGIVFKEI